MRRKNIHDHLESNNGTRQMNEKQKEAKKSEIRCCGGSAQIFVILFYRYT